MKKNIVKYFVGKIKGCTFASSNKRQTHIDLIIPNGLKEDATCLRGIETPLKRNLFIINCL